MAQAEEAIFARLSTFAGLTALVPAARIGPIKRIENWDLPAVVWFRVSGPPVYAMGNETGLVEAQYQITAFASSYSAVKAVAEQIRLAMSNLHGVYGGVTIDWVEFRGNYDLFDPETGVGTEVYQCPGYFMINYRQALP